MKGFVINMDTRPDRFERIVKQFEKSYISIQRVQAVVEPDLNVFRERIHPWNFQNLKDEKIQRIVGCCLSHIKTWKQIVKLNQIAFVFEDDVCFINNASFEKFNSINFNLLDFDIIWLNDKISDKPGTFSDFKLIPFDGSWKTTESYIITPKFAKVLLRFMENNLGAIDAHMNQFLKANQQTKAFIFKFFCQYDRNDTNIQII